MARKNFTKNQILEATTPDLIFRMNFLFMQSGGADEDRGVALADIRECVAIDKELKRRLHRVTASFNGEASK